VKNTLEIRLFEFNDSAKITPVVVLHGDLDLGEFEVGEAHEENLIVKKMQFACGTYSLFLGDIIKEGNSREQNRPNNFLE